MDTPQLHTDDYLDMIRGYFKLNADSELNQKKLVALVNAGATSGNIFFEALGCQTELTKLLELLGRGDMLVVPTAADVASSPAELAALIERLGKIGARFAAVQDPWMAYHSHAAQSDMRLFHTPFAQNNPDHSPMTQRKVGRPKGPQRDIAPKLDFAINLYHTAGHLSIRQICAMAKLNERTFYRHLKRHGYLVVRRLKGRKPARRGL